MHGLSLFAAGRLFSAGEVFARYEHVDPNTRKPGTDYTFVTLGGSFSPSAVRECATASSKGGSTSSQADARAR